jgi:hypothetical protein
MHEALSRAQEILQIRLPNLSDAAKKSETDVRRFTEYAAEAAAKFPVIAKRAKDDDVDIVLLGSLARGEATDGSDCDYFVLQNDCEPEISQHLTEIASAVRKELQYDEPGSQGVFGDIVIAASLYERVGLESDSNQNLTHRLLLLTESVSVFSPRTRDAVIGRILKRYSLDNYSPNTGEPDEAKVPRYLLNDLVRFWRTMAVDFGAKRWRGGRAGSNLRLLKLRTTRKILFAGPLSTVLLVPVRTSKASELGEYLESALSQPPLAQLAGLLSDDKVSLLGSSKDAIGKILLAYDELLGLFDDKVTREAIKNSAAHTATYSKIKAKCDRIAVDIESSLEKLFFDDPLLAHPVRQYGLF